MKFGTLHQIVNPVTVTLPKIEIFKIQDGGGRHLENRFFGHKSLTDCPISAKFCMRKQNSRSTRATGQKCKFLESNMADGRHLENRKIAISQWKIVRFLWNLVHYIRYWTRLQPRDQKSIIFKIQDGGGGHLENRFFGHKSLTDCPISAKFCMRKQNDRSTRATWQKLHIFKFQHGGRPPFWKSLNCYISVKNRPILMKFGTLHQILNPITFTWPKIAIFEIQDGDCRHLENRFLAITH